MNTDGLGPINATTILIQVAFLGITAMFLVGIFTRKADDPREVTSWSRAHGLVLTEHNRAMITWFVRLNLVLRVVGGVSGMLLGSLFDAAFGLHTSGGAAGCGSSWVGSPAGPGPNVVSSAPERSAGPHHSFPDA